MNRTLKLILSLICLLALIALTGIYRSYIDGTPVIVGFDRAAMAFLLAIWQLLNNSIVLTALLLTLIFWLAGADLQMIRAGIKKISAGGLSIEGDWSDAVTLKSLESKNTISQTQLERLNNEFESMIRSFPNYLNWFLLKANNKPYAIDDLLEILKNEMMNDFSLENVPNLKTYIEGVFSAINHVFIGTVYNYNIIENERGIVILSLKPKALGLIKENLKDQIEY